MNPIGPRACYDEGKRVAETLTYGFHRQDGVDVRVARIFNTYGKLIFIPVLEEPESLTLLHRTSQYVSPRRSNPGATGSPITHHLLTGCILFHLTVNPADGRVVSNFIMQALRGEEMTVYGDGTQTRSFQYIHDLIDGLIALMNSNETRPVNIGNGDEFTIGDFAKKVRDTVRKVKKEDDGVETPPVKIVHGPIPTDDPQKRRPDTNRAKEVLGWQPKWTVEMGLEEMVRYYKAKLAEGSL